MQERNQTQNTIYIVYKFIYMKLLEQAKLIYDEANKKCFPVGMERNGRYAMTGKGHKEFSFCGDGILSILIG